MGRHAAPFCCSTTRAACFRCSTGFWMVWLGFLARWQRMLLSERCFHWWWRNADLMFSRGFTVVSTVGPLLSITFYKIIICNMAVLWEPRSTFNSLQWLVGSLVMPGLISERMLLILVPQSLGISLNVTSNRYSLASLKVFYLISHKKWSFFMLYSISILGV